MAITREDRALFIVDAALCWFEDNEGEACHFCDPRSDTEGLRELRHDRECPLVVAGFVDAEDRRTRAELAPVRGFADYWTIKDLE